MHIHVDKDSIGEARLGLNYVCGLNQFRSLLKSRGGGRGQLAVFQKVFAILYRKRKWRKID